MNKVKIKICGLFRDEDIDYINEARPDYTGFVFAESRRQVSPGQAARLRKNLAPGIVPVGVFVNAPLETVCALYRNGVIDIAQLHGIEDEVYITRLKEECGIPVIKVFLTPGLTKHHEPLPGACRTLTIDRLGTMPFACEASCGSLINNIDYYLFDSGSGSGKTFNWDALKTFQFTKPWFLAGGINAENIEKAIAYNPFAIDVSGGAETNGIKDREKILQLTASVSGAVLPPLHSAQSGTP